MLSSLDVVDMDANAFSALLMRRLGLGLSDRKTRTKMMGVRDWDRCHWYTETVGEKGGRRLSQHHPTTCLITIKSLTI